jgi:hypothetical protein
LTPEKAKPPAQISDLIKKMLLDKDRQVSALLLFIKEYENDKKGVSRQKVADYMKKEGLSSSSHYFKHD